MRPKGSAELLSGRRWRALKLLREKLSLNEVARRIGCAASSVMRWRNAWRQHGAEALAVRFSPGRPRRLTPRQEQRLVRILLQAAMTYGYRTERWTAKGAGALRTLGRWVFERSMMRHSPTPHHASALSSNTPVTPIRE